MAKAMLTFLYSMSASSIENVSEAGFPANDSPREKLMFALKYAALAPTESGWLPWHFRMADTHLELLAKNSPAREEADPDRREFIIGCGSALQYLKLALKHFGCLGRVVLFPDLGQPALVAKVHFGFGRERDAQEKLLFEAMPGGRTNNSPLGAMPVSETMLAALSHAAAGERGWLDFVQSEASRQQVLKITLAGNRWWMSFDRSSAQPADASVEENASRPAQPFSTFGGRNADAWNLAEHHSEFSTATLAVVKTKTDDKHGWLEAGQTMARTVLQAQALGLSWDFFNPVRRREAREALRRRVGHKGFAQVILRFGPLVLDEPVRVDAPANATEMFR
jgi:hypothetical protein